MMKNRSVGTALMSLLLLSVTLAFDCKKSNSGGTTPPPPPPNPPQTNEVDFWLTQGNESVKLQKQTGILAFQNNTNHFPAIEVDETTSFQTVDGFGFTLTGGSVEVINQLSPAQKTELLNDLFGKDSTAVSISYLRLSIGASDLSSTVYSYNDMPAGETDPGLIHFSLAQDATTLVPLLKEILAINPAIKIMATPWSPPVWMKDNGSTIGGSLKPEYYSAYALYFVKYIQAMKAEGITIDAITPQNEPLHPGNNPSLLMTASQQTDFIKNHLGPAFRSASIGTKIIVYDHNCDRPDYPLAILNDPVAKTFIDGSAFHLYGGDISALSQVHAAHPDRNVYFTEQYTSSTGQFGGDLQWHLKNVIIGSMRNWSKTALEWNLANSSTFGPHTEGGCTVCKGGITILSTSSYTKNVGYYIIAHASKFVPAGSVRIHSSLPTSLPNVAFKTPAGKKVLIVLNEGSSQQFNIRYNGKLVTTYLDIGAVGTYIW